MKTIKHIVIVAPSNATLLDIAGPLEVFTKAIEHQIANDYQTVYQTHVVSIKKSKLVKTSSGISIVAESNYKAIDYDIDTLILAGALQYNEAMPNNAFLEWVNSISLFTNRICSICTGAFFLAEAGLLDGRKVTTHWNSGPALAKAYPSVKVDVEPIFIKDDKIYTSAGTSAGMDLSLALVEEDFGKNFALEIAKQMVLFLKRPGNQSQYSTLLHSQHTDYKPIEKLLSWITENLEKELTVVEMAKITNMSERNFARIFKQELGISPAKYIGKLRLETAARLIIETSLTMDEVALKTGLKTSQNLRRLFIKTFKNTPIQFRNNFSKTNSD